MARKNPMHLREVEICKRIRDFRRETRLSRVAFAQQCGVDSSTLANYEHARVPVPYAVAKKVSEAFDINQRWLATGKLPKKPYMEISSALEKLIPTRVLFSVAYDRFLAQLITESLHDAAKTSGLSVEALDEIAVDPWLPVGEHSDNLALAAQRKLLLFTVQVGLRLPNKLRDQFVTKVKNAAWAFIQKHRIELDEALKKAPNFEAEMSAFLKAKLRAKKAD